MNHNAGNNQAFQMPSPQGRGINITVSNNENVNFYMIRRTLYQPPLPSGSTLPGGGPGLGYSTVAQSQPQNQWGLQNQNYSHHQSAGGTVTHQNIMFCPRLQTFDNGFRYRYPLALAPTNHVITGQSYPRFHGHESVNSNSSHVCAYCGFLHPTEAGTRTCSSVNTIHPDSDGRESVDSFDTQQERTRDWILSTSPSHSVNPDLESAVGEVETETELPGTPTPPSTLW